MGQHTTVRLRLTVAALALVAVAGCTASAGAPAPVPAQGAEAGSVTGPTSPTSEGGSAFAGVLLPDEGSPSSSPDFTGWTTDASSGQPWLLDPCRPTDYPTDASRTSFRTVSQSGPEAFDARQLAVYPSAEIAAEVLAGFRRALIACSAGTTGAGDRWTSATRDVPGLGDDALVAASTIGSPPNSPAGDRIAVTRVGSAVFLAYSGGEYGTAKLDGGVDAVQAVARRFLDSL